MAYRGGMMGMGGRLRREEIYIRIERKKVKSLNHVRLFATPWTVAYQAPLSMGFSRQEYWSGLPIPSPTTIVNMYKVLGVYQALF